MGKVSRIPTIGDYTIFFNSLFFVLYSAFLQVMSGCATGELGQVINGTAFTVTL